MSDRADFDNIIPFPGHGGRVGALQLRADLLLMPAPVWRRLLLPREATFWDLHVALQDVFGWRDRHLHQFTVQDPADGEPVRVGVPGGPRFLDERDEVLPGWEHAVARFECGFPFLYTYDLADAWQHELNVEGVVFADDPQTLPCCLAGAGRVPPENCGGPDAVTLELVTPDAPFVPEGVAFSDPRRRWREVFGHD